MKILPGRQTTLKLEGDKNMTPLMRINKQKTLALLALLVMACTVLTSCADENLVNNNGGENVNPADYKLATTTVTFSADAGCSYPT